MCRREKKSAWFFQAQPSCQPRLHFSSTSFFPLMKHIQLFFPPRMHRICYIANFYLSMYYWQKLKFFTDFLTLSNKSNNFGTRNLIRISNVDALLFWWCSMQYGKLRGKKMTSRNTGSCFRYKGFVFILCEEPDIHVFLFADSYSNYSY